MLTRLAVILLLLIPNCANAEGDYEDHVTDMCSSNPSYCADRDYGDLWQEAEEIYKGETE